MKVYVAWEHPIFTNVDFVANQSLNPQAWIKHSQIFWQSMIFSFKIFRRLSKTAPEVYNSGKLDFQQNPILDSCLSQGSPNIKVNSNTPLNGVKATSTDIGEFTDTFWTHFFSNSTKALGRTSIGMSWILNIISINKLLSFFILCYLKGQFVQYKITSKRFNLDQKAIPHRIL